MRLHKDVDTDSRCGGQVADGRELFGTDHWCVYCGAKWSDRRHSPECFTRLACVPECPEARRMASAVASKAARRMRDRIAASEGARPELVARAEQLEAAAAARGCACGAPRPYGEGLGHTAECMASDEPIALPRYYEHPITGCRLDGHQQGSGNALGAGPSCPSCGVRYSIVR